MFNDAQSARGPIAVEFGEEKDSPAVVTAGCFPSATSCPLLHKLYTEKRNEKTVETEKDNADIDDVSVLFSLDPDDGGNCSDGIDDDDGGGGGEDLSDLSDHESIGSEPYDGCIIVDGTVLDPPFFVKFIRSRADLDAINAWRLAYYHFRAGGTKGAAGEVTALRSKLIDAVPAKVVTTLMAGGGDAPIPMAGDGLPVVIEGFVSQLPAERCAKSLTCVTKTVASSLRASEISQLYIFT